MQGNQEDGRKRDPQEALEPQPPAFVVGVGASAGGLEALERLFTNMPTETGMAFVVVQHLSPDFESLMEELLRPKTGLPVHRVEHGVRVEANAVYLIPPKKEMIISDGRLLLTDKDPTQGLTLPIDQFFRSLAQDLGQHSVGIILSGTGSDGSRGIRDIHNAGGLVVAQLPDSAKFDGMPRSAINTGIVHQELLPEEMPAALIRHFSGETPLNIDMKIASEEGMSAIFGLLRREYDIDFSHYKPNTVGRRIERRLSLNHALDLEDYITQLKDNPHELNSLYRDLLIGVTSFFRDDGAYQELAATLVSRVLPKAQDAEELRCWVAGCATGEEAYSLAILIHEQMESANLDNPLKEIPVKIFATDVHRASLDIASAGIYPAESLQNISPERLERYFTRHGHQFQIAAELRKMVVFAPHNVIKDAPFTKLDLISCRNLLIYLQPVAQRKAISLFHFGLKTDGILFLGPSEHPADLQEEFECLNEQGKLYRKRRDVRLPPDLRLPVTTGSRPLPLNTLALGTSSAHRQDSALMSAYDAILEELAPPSLLIDASRALVHAFGGAERYLHFKGGRSSLDVLELVDPELRIPLSGALQRAAKERLQVTLEGIRLITTDGDADSVKISVRPIHNRVANAMYMLVSFSPLESPAIELPSKPALKVDQLSKDQIASLETELRYARENLQATIEELETSNEELHATNEELVASNEELQSTNEELHSVNEELYTVNAEYQRKIAELTELSTDMDNLLASTEIGTIFVDRDLMIRKFTPQIGQLFDLLPQDVGRRIDAFLHKIEYSSLVQDAEQVLATAELLEREVTSRDGKWYLIRLLPYRADNRIEGVVITLIETTSIKETETRLLEKDRQLQGILDNSTAIIFLKDLEGRYLLTNRHVEQKLRVSASEALGKTDHDLLPPEIATPIRRNDLAVVRTGEVMDFEETISESAEEIIFLSIKFPLKNDRDEVFAIGGVCTNITRQKQAERDQRNAVKRRDEFLAMLSHELRNPLGAIVHASELLNTTSTVETAHAVAAKATATIKRQAEQMARLLDDLLDVSRIRQGRLEIQRSPVALREVVERALESVQPLVEKGRYQVQTDLCPEAIWVDGDAARLQQLVGNLLTNAMKYSPQDSQVQLSLAVESSSSHQKSLETAGRGAAVIRVVDHGVGIAPELLSGVFDLFFQAQPTIDRSDGGMGVGLTLAKAICELHDGAIEVHSDGPDTGSEFVVRLPLTSAPENGAGGRTPPPHKEQLRIVIVEDSDDSRDMLAEILRLEGHEVIEATDGVTGVQAIETHRPDLAFVDVGLPEMSGYEVVKRIRKNRDVATVAIYALTGYGRPEDRGASVEAGFDGHLVKPLRLEVLTEVIASINQPAV
ncbi:MAG: chemotaxis protein CheB [Planctomycetota bacterium]